MTRAPAVDHDGRAALRRPTIVHVDMDAFFVAVEVRDDPSLAGRPVVVGGAGERGVVAAASYEARSHGVHSAMPALQARRLCPDAVFLPGRFARYQEVSAEVFAVFRAHTPLVEGISLDEAFLDVAGAERLFGPAPEVAARIRRQVAERVGLACSVGVAPRKLTAKLASEAAKPSPSPSGAVPGRGIVVVDAAGELAFLHAHPVGALWGVGPATRARLERLGVRTVGDLAAVPEAVLVGALGAAHGRSLHRLAWADDHRPVVPEQPPKSVGHEETFAVDRRTPDEVAREAVRLADAVAQRLRRHGLAGRTVQVKVRFHDFRTITRSATLEAPVDTGTEVARAAKQLLDLVDPRPGVRLLGVSVSQLVEGGAARQLRLDDPGEPDWERATKAVDEVRARFGAAAVVPATLAGDGGLRPKRRGDQQWGPGDTGAAVRPGGRVVDAGDVWEDRAYPARPGG